MSRKEQKFIDFKFDYKIYSLSHSELVISSDFRYVDE